jgi:hypothetical protein
MDFAPSHAACAEFIAPGRCCCARWNEVEAFERSSVRIRHTVDWEGPYALLRGFPGIKSMVEYADVTAHKNPLLSHQAKPPLTRMT